MTPVSIQGKAEASTRPERPPRALLGLSLSLRARRGPPPRLPPVQGPASLGAPTPAPRGPPCLPREGLESSVAQGPRLQAGLAAPALGQAQGG